MTKSTNTHRQLSTLDLLQNTIHVVCRSKGGNGVAGGNGGGNGVGAETVSDTVSQITRADLPRFSAA